MRSSSRLTARYIRWWCGWNPTGRKVKRHDLYRPVPYGGHDGRSGPPATDGMLSKSLRTLPAASGEIMSRLTRAAPVPCPLNVIRLESPPNPPILSLSQRRAATKKKNKEKEKENIRGRRDTTSSAYWYPTGRSCLASVWRSCFYREPGPVSGWRPSAGILRRWRDKMQIIRHFIIIILALSLIDLGRCINDADKVLAVDSISLISDGKEEGKRRPRNIYETIVVLIPRMPRR